MKKKILSILSSPKAADWIDKKLQTQEMEVFYFYQAKIGLNSIKEINPDLVIIDSHIYDIPIFLVIYLLKSLDIPIIMLLFDKREKENIFFSDVDKMILFQKNSIEELLPSVLKMLKKKPVVCDQEKKERVEKNILKILNTYFYHSFLYDKIIEKITSIENFASFFENIASMFYEYFSLSFFSFAYYSKSTLVFHSLLPEDNYTSAVSFFLKNFDTYLDEHSYLKMEEHKKLISLPLKKRDRVEEVEEYFSKDKNRVGGIFFTHTMEEEELVFFKNFLPFLFKLFYQVIEYQDNQFAKKRLSFLFSRFLPVKVIDDLLQRSDLKSLKIGEKREVAVLFSHVMDFHSIENNNSAENTVDFLNLHFSGLSYCIKKHGGEINKFIGDAVFAMFGAPESYEDNEMRAVKSAIDMIRLVKKTEFQDLVFGEKGYSIGIGLHIGKVIVGNIGSSDNFDYTAIGDTVNLAARLESLNKYYQTRILVSEEIYREAKNKEFLFREVDTVMVKGKDTPTTLYTILFPGEFDPAFLSSYHKAVKMFKMGNFLLAHQYFSESSRLNSKDFLVNLYLKRSEELMQNPPPDWNGAIALDFK